MNRRDALRSLLTLPAVGSISVAQVKPTDVIVITFPGRISDDSARRIEEYAKKAFPDNKFIVFSDGGTVSSVIRGIGAGST